MPAEKAPIPPPSPAPARAPPPVALAAPAPPLAEAPPEPNLYDLAEQAWRDLIAASDQVQSVANRLKKSARSMDGYEIEKALVKHKPDLMRKHLEGLRLHRKENKL